MKFLMAFLLVFVLLANGLQAGTAYAATQQGTISVVGENGNPLLAETPVQFTDNETAFSSLFNAVGGNVDYTNDSTYGTSINGIKGLKAEGTNYWAFYINGIQAQLGAGTYTVHDGDHLTFMYTDWTKSTEKVSLNVTGEQNKVVYDSKPWDIGINGQPTALQLLQVVLGPNKVELKSTQYGPMIVSIDNTAAQGNSYWAFYINGQMANVGADSYHLQPNDQISFRYETYDPSGGGSDNGNTLPTPPKFSNDQLQKAIDNASQYTVNNGVNDWGAIALKQAGKTIPASYLAAVMKDIQNKNGKFHYITDAEKYILGVLAAGGNPTNIGGFNIVESVYNGDVTKQGLNGVAFALIALDSANFSIPTSAAWTKEKLVNELLANQHADGGFGLYTTTTTSDTDVTAMIVTALAPYKDQAGVKEKLDKAVQYLSTQFLEAKIDNSSTAAEIVIALSALGIDANGSSFIKDNVSLMQSLLAYQNSDGGFGWHSGDKSDTFSTPEGFKALVAYQLYLNGKGSLYHFPLTENTETGKQPTNQISTGSSNQQHGHTLPNTATNTENIVLFGLLLIMMGMILYFLQNRRKAS